MTTIGMHLRNNVVGYISLFLTLTMGTAWAAANIGSEQVVDNSLRSADLKNNAAVRSADVVDDTVRGGGLQSSDIASNVLTGADIYERSLGTVNNADMLDGLNADAFVRKCQKGSIHSFVKVNGNLNLSTTFSTTGTSVAYNCAGPAPLVRRLAAGAYEVCFPNNGSIAGVANAVSVDELSDIDNFVTWKHDFVSACPGGDVFRIFVNDNSGDWEDAPFFFAAL